MQDLKLGDVIVLKIDVGEPELTSYVVQKLNISICTIVPFISFKYDKKTASYKGSSFITESKPEIFVHKNEIASICCLNTELTNIFCRNPFVDKIIHGNYSNLEEAKLESNILKHE